MNAPQHTERTMPSNRRPKPGVRAIERAIEFLEWADAQQRPLTWQRIAERLDVSRATACRYLAVYRDMNDRRRLRAGLPVEEEE